jgi:thioredoxin 1
MKRTSIKEAEEVIAQGGECIMKIGADWCAPCRAIAPVLEQISSESNITVFEIDVDSEEKSKISEYGVRSVPTVIAYKGGKEISRGTGAMSKPKILQLLS